MSTLQGPLTPNPTDSQGSPSAAPGFVRVRQSQVTAHPCGYTTAAKGSEVLSCHAR